MNKQERLQVLHATTIILLTIALALITAPSANAGAVETVTNTNDSGAGSLRQAIADVDAGGTIEFAAGVSGTIVLSGELVINKSLTINGPSADVLTISGNNESQVFYITGNNVALSGLTVTDGYHDCCGGGIHWASNGMLTIDNCAFFHNKSPHGGAVRLDGGVVLVNNSTFLENTAEDGGGALRLEEVTLIATNSTFYSNIAERRGGAILASEEAGANISNCTFSGNIANGGEWNAGGGGAIAVFEPVNIKNSIVVGNYAPDRPTAADILIRTNVQLTSFDFNLLGEVLNLGTFTPAVNDQVGVTAAQVNLGALAIEAPGTTATLPLQEGSIAIDGITNAAQCTDVQGNLVATDQRGINRPQGAFCDIGAYEAVFVVVVDIDIKPGSDPNSINLRSKGVVPVAILTTAEFDASSVDPSTVLFANAAPVNWAVEDVDYDGDMDLVFYFKARELVLDEYSTEAPLSGLTQDGHDIYGIDTVNIVP